MAMKENRFGSGLMQFQGKSDANLASEVSRNGRRVLGAINENIVVEAPGYRKDVLRHTRKYDAQNLSIQQKQSLSGPEQLAEVVHEVDESQIPMYVMLTEAMMDEIDRMDEVDMEDVEDQIMDIDSKDVKNELAVVEYIDDIYAFYRKSERRDDIEHDLLLQNAGFVTPSYMEQQSDINERMRAILIDWLIEVHYKFELMEETLFLTVNIIDRFLERQTVVRKELQLVGVTAMLMACKYEEVSVPVVADFIYISDKAYTRQEILNMEKLMLNTLQFNMSVPTPYVFMRRFLKAAESDKKLELLSFYMVELCLVEYSMLEFQPSMLAAAAVYTAMCTMDRSSKQWSKTTEWHSKYSEDQLLVCAKMIVMLHKKSASGKLTGVHRKYSTSKFGYAARCDPAQFLLLM